MTIEKAIAASLEPIVDALLSVEKRLDEVQLTPGPQGVPGQSGADGKSVTVHEVVNELLTVHGDVLKGTPGTPGAPGKDGESVSPELVVLKLKQDQDFLAATKGPQGNQGAPGYPGKDGEPGRDATPDDVAAFLKQDAYFMSVVKGATGEQGEQGNPGEDGLDGKNGADADPQVVVDLIKADRGFAEQLRGADGAPGIGIKAIAQSEDLKQLDLELDNGQVATIQLPPGPAGEPGKDGADGRNGLGIDAKQWTPGIYRERSVVMHDLGRYARAIRDTTGEPGRSPDWERVGSAGSRFTGVKSETFDYQDGDLYIDKGTTFIWTNGKGHMFAQRGKDGRDGKDGQNGASPVGAVLSGTKLVFAFDNGETLDVDLAPMVKLLVDTAVAERLAQPVDLPVAKNDLEAADKGVPMFGMYRNGASVKIRAA
jgi:hypothetical protein